MIGKLEMFIALAREAHFGRAAASLGITQPTLSSGIRQLEEQLGVQLVRRGSRFGALTPEGQRALLWARRIVGDARRMREEMRFSRHGLAGEVRLAAIPTALTWASRLAARFAERNPNVRFAIQSRTSVEILAMIENLDVDAGISYLDNEPLGRVDTTFLYRETYTLVCAPGHPLAGAQAVGWGDLGGLSLCLLSPDMQNRRIINRKLMEAGVEARVQMESNSTVVLVSHVAEGGWATILPGDVAAFLTSGKGLHVVPIRHGGEGHAVGLVVPHAEVQTPVLGALADVAGRLAPPGA